MPFPGSFFEQPYKIIEAFNIIDTVIKEKQEKKRKEEEEKIRRQRK